MYAYMLGMDSKKKKKKNIMDTFVSMFVASNGHIQNHPAINNV